MIAVEVKIVVVVSVGRSHYEEFNHRGLHNQSC